MAEPDYSLAAQIKPPQAPNPIEMLTGLENLRRAHSAADVSGLEAKQKGVDIGALQSYQKSGNLQDLRGASPELGVQATAQQTADTQLGALHRARNAYELINIKDPKERAAKAYQYGQEWINKGWMSPTSPDWQRIKNGEPVSDLMLNNIIRNSMNPDTHMAMTGQTADADAAARVRYEGRPMPAAEPYGYPAVRPGGPLAQGSPVGTIQGQGNVSTPMPTQGPNTSTAPQPNSTPADIANHNKNDPYYQEAPPFQVAPPLPAGPGIVNQGVHPIAMKAATDGLAKLTEYNKGASAAAKDQAEIGSLRTGLQGAASTGAFTEAKMTVASWIYGVTHDVQAAANLTGVNLPALEVFQKDATRRGLTFARQTEGAREAVMAIQIALRANPGLLNTKEGNLKMLDILEAGDKYDQEQSKAAQSYLMKQQDTTGTGHLEGFENHFITAHHPSTFVSKAMPYKLPPDHNALRDGVTYEVPTAVKDKKGTPQTVNGTWNAKTQHFDPVQP